MLRHKVEGWISKRCHICFDQFWHLLYSPVGKPPYASLLCNSTTDFDITFMKRMFIWLIIALSVDIHPKCCHVQTRRNNTSLYEFLFSRIFTVNCRKILALLSSFCSYIRQLSQCIWNTASGITKFFRFGTLCIYFYKYYIMTKPSTYQAPLPLIWHLSRSWIHRIYTAEVSPGITLTTILNIHFLFPVL
jgi:hypothetical protein